MSTRYLTMIDGEAAVVEITRREGDRVEALVTYEERETAQPVNFAHRAGPDGRYHVFFDDGRVMAGRILGQQQDFTVTGGSARLQVRAMNEMDALLSADAMGGDEGSVTVSMPGRIVKLLVAVGDAVEAGQSVMIVEAMKMENQVKAGRSGVVVDIHVDENESVEAEALLMTIGDQPEG